MARGDQLTRQWRIIQALSGVREGLSASELADRLDCHVRTVYRDLEALEGAGFPIYNIQQEGGRSLWSVLRTGQGRGVPIPFTLTELMALYFSRGLLGVLKGTFIFESLSGLLEKIKDTLGPEAVEYLDRLETTVRMGQTPYKRYAELKETIDTVNRAILDRRCLDIVYFALSRKQTTRRLVEPYRLLFHDAAFYLVGHCRMRGSVRVFALDRARSMEVTEEAFTLPDGFSIDRLLDESFGIFHGEVRTVRILFSPEAAGYITERVWHDTQKLTPLPDGSVILEARVSGLAEIRHWIMKWGAKARVLEPPELADRIREEALKMAKAYAGPVFPEEEGL